MLYKVEISNPARKDLLQISTYLAVDCAMPATAEKQMKKLFEAVDSLCMQPYRCRRFLDVEEFIEIPLRTLIVNPWQILFSIDEESLTVSVLRVVSSRMDIASRITTSRFSENL